MEKKSRAAKQALVVTTAHKGVFFGYGIPSDADTIRLENARMCVYWDAAIKGVLGLAATGPLGSSRVGPAVPALTLRDVTSVMEVSEEAIKNWEKGSWGK